MDGDLNTVNITETNDSKTRMFILELCHELQLRRANQSDIDLCRGLVGATDVIKEIPPESKYSLSCLYAAAISVSLLGNSLVILSFVCNQHMRSTMNVFILSLAISDFFVTVTCMPINITTALYRYWIFGDFLCKVMPFMTNLTVASSSLTLCCIAIDRYYAIVHPLKTKFTKSPKSAAAFLAAVWILAVASSTPYVFLYDVKTVFDGGASHNICVATDDGPVESLKMWLTFVILLIVPFILIGVTYAVIALELWVKVPVGTRVRISSTDQQTRYKRKAIKMLVLVVLLYAFCWSPLLVFDVISKENNLQLTEVNLNIRCYLQWLALSGACYNPIIYAFMNERFRRNFATILLCRRARVHMVQDESRTNRRQTLARNADEVEGNRNVLELRPAIVSHM